MREQLGEYEQATERVTITGHYGGGACHEITVYFSDEPVTAEDMAAVIRALRADERPVTVPPRFNPTIPGVGELGISKPWWGQ